MDEFYKISLLETRERYVIDGKVEYAELPIDWGKVVKGVMYE